MHVGPVEENNGSAWVLPAADEKIKGRPCTRLGRVVLGWLGLLPDAARSWVRFEQFLELVEGVSDMGDRERDLLLHRRMVCRLSSFILQVGVMFNVLHMILHSAVTLDCGRPIK